MTAQPKRRALAQGAAIVTAIVAAVALVGAAGLLVWQANSDDADGAASYIAPDDPVPTQTSDSSTPTTAQTSPLASRADPSWVTQTAQKTGIPERAMAAYAGASIQLAEEQPDCHLDWATLAGIGEVESQHGTLAGGAIDASGQQSPALYGIQLTGESTAHIADTDDGLLDGDPTWDRAVGPMQFIPSTWALYSADGNGDGVMDPQNIDDAVLAAGRYLCKVGGDMSTSSNWIAAVGAYNASVDYNNRVVAAANYYIANS